MNKTNWVGIHPTKFAPYSNYINTDGTCGIVASAVLLAYYQDNIDPNLFSHHIRKPHDQNHQPLINFLTKELTTFLPYGLSIFDVTLGINRFLRKYSNNPAIKTTAHCLVGSALGPMRAHSNSKQPTPIILSTLSVLKAPTNYRNHFLIGYAYRNKQILCHDNHGKIDAIIESKWTFSTIALTRKVTHQNK